MRCLSISFCLLFMCYCMPVFAENEKDINSEIRELKEEIRELRSIIIEQRKKYNNEIRSLKEEIDKLKREKSEKQTQESPIADLEALKKEAEIEAETQVSKESNESVEFKAGSLSLQALNPELSLVGDFMGVYTADDSSDDNFEFKFRTLGLHFQSYLDPYSRLKGAIEFNEEGAEFGEAYMTRYGVLWDGLNVTIGKFRQQFGVVNRWHKHGLDWVDFPLPLREIFGEGGLNQVGVSMDYNLDLGNTTNNFTLQITNATNGRVFAQNTKKRPSVLFHYKNYRDLSVDSYFEFGFTGLWGVNNDWSYSDVEYDDTKMVSVYGLDFTYLWEPSERMRYRNFEWRSELYYINKEVVFPYNSDERLNAWGGYTSLQSKISRTVNLGVRFDYFKPDETNSVISNAYYPLSTSVDSDRFLYALYLTWAQSPFVKYRIEYDYETGSGSMDNDIHRIFLQAIFAAGPHKHERY